MTTQTDPSDASAPPVYAADRCPTWWGMAGVFPGEFECWKGDDFSNKLNFVADRGFNGGHVALGVLSDPEKRKVVEEIQREKNQAHFVGFHPDMYGQVEEVRAGLSDGAEKLLTARSEGMDLPVAVVVIPGGVHRFTKNLPLAQQLDFLTAVLSPMVKRLTVEGVDVAIENHGDYYVSDLVTLCKRVPGLTIMLDTGNCFLIGERPELIPDEAYPLISCTHYKDHYVQPNARSLNFELVGATLGEGHVGLEAIYQKLLELHPDPASVKLMIEWVPDPDKNPVDCFNDSLKFLERISGGNFTSTPAPMPVPEEEVNA